MEDLEKHNSEEQESVTTQHISDLVLPCLIWIATVVTTKKSCLGLQSRAKQELQFTAKCQTSPVRSCGKAPRHL